jgi:hypothetical protein
MRKRLISPIPGDRTPLDRDGLDLATLGWSRSHQRMKPIPSKVRCNSERDETGALLMLDLRLSDFCSTSHKTLKRIWLVFEETETQRTQEFVLR